MSYNSLPYLWENPTSRQKQIPVSFLNVFMSINFSGPERRENRDHREYAFFDKCLKAFRLHLGSMEQLNCISASFAVDLVIRLFLESYNS